MARTMNPVVKAILTGNQTKLCALASLDFGDTPTPITEDIVRVNTTGTNLDWDGNTFLGLGGLGAVSSAEESGEIQSYDMTFSLAYTDPALLARALEANYKGKFAYLWVAALDDDYNIEVDSNGIGPLLLFAGRMYNMEIVLGKQGSINVIASSRLSDWENPHGGRFNHGSQVSRVDDLDSGFEYVTVISSIEIIWGSKGGSTVVSPAPGFNFKNFPGLPQNL